MNTRIILNTIVVILSTILAVLLYFTIPGVTMMTTMGMNITDTKPYAMSNRVIDDSRNFNTIQQGQQVAILEEELSDGTMKFGVCSVGFIDVVERKLYVAAHCALPENEKHPPVREVMLRDTVIGEIYPNQNYNKNSMANDWTIINVTNDDIVLNSNRFSGDKIVDPQNVHPGDKVYTYGSTSGLSEGVVFGVHGNQIYITKSVIDHGDSGGAAWIDGKGFIGVLSNKRGYNVEDVESKDGGYVTVVNAVNTQYDDTVEFKNIERMYARWFYTQGIKNILQDIF